MPNPSTDHTPPPGQGGPDEELADIEEEKADQVLEREGLETALMDDDRSEVGEQIDDAEENG